MAGNDPKDVTLIARMGADASLQTVARELMTKITEYRYSYNFSWLGRPVIQYPQDLIAMQEIIWQVKPDLIIETGIAHGGSLVFYASMLELLGGQGQVLGVDIDIRQHNKHAIEEHPLSRRITMMQGSSLDETLVADVREFARGKERVLVTLDSNHTHDHVLAELQIYSPLVTKDSYLVVFDTIVEDMPDDFYPDRPWSRGNNPKTAVREFMKTTDRFEIDTEITNKLVISAAPDGYLRCVK